MKNIKLNSMYDIIKVNICNTSFNYYNTITYQRTCIQYQRPPAVTPQLAKARPYWGASFRNVERCWLKNKITYLLTWSENWDEFLLRLYEENNGSNVKIFLLFICYFKKSFKMSKNSRIQLHVNFNALNSGKLLFLISYQFVIRSKNGAKSFFLMFSGSF
jgi:hypothetical protein